MCVFFVERGRVGHVFHVRALACKRETNTIILTLALPDIPPPVHVIFPATLKVLRDAAPHPPHPPTASPSDRHGFSSSSAAVLVESKEAFTVGGGKVMSPSP